MKGELDGILVKRNDEIKDFFAYMTDVISVQALSKRFGDLVAVDNLSFTVSKGICFGLLGPNGAGKTTTIEMIEGISKPSSGVISLFGQPATKDVYKRVGIQFQNTALQDYLNVEETLKLFASFYDQSTAIDSLIELCSLDEFTKQDARKLSGGQRQRLLLALALINEPDLLFLDEPTTGLDPQARRNFWDLINKIKAQGKTIVLTTHYMDEAQVLCDQVAIMDKGQIIESGTPASLLNKHFSGVLVKLPRQNITGLTLSIPYLINGDLIEIISDQVETLLQDLIQRGVSLEGMQISTANLEDLFLKLTGHALRG